MGLDLLTRFESAMRDRNVSIIEFAESEKYCGKPLYPRQRVLLKLIWLEEMDGWEEDVLTEWINNPRGEVYISPNIRERRDRLREEGYKHFREVILVGGRRASKGHITGISIAKKMWDMIALENPQDHFGIDRDKQIYTTIIAASEEQAKRYQFADARGSITSCAAMQTFIAQTQEKLIGIYTPKDQEKQLSFERLGKKEIKVPSSLRVRASAANAATVRGEATIIAVLDEMAHMMEGVNSKSSAEEIYEAITPALDQFGPEALIFENSSPYTKVGKFYENYCKAMNIDIETNTQVSEDIDYRMMAFQYPSWELYRDWDKDIKKRFKRPLVEDVQTSEIMQLEERKNPEKFKVERRAQFAEVVEGFLDPRKVDLVFEPWEGIKLRTRSDRSGFGPEVRFKAHGDPATTTANFGWSIAHLEYFPDEEGREIPHVFFDKLHAWIPGEWKDHTINYLDIQDELLDDLIKFRPSDVSFDQFQSNALINYLRREAMKKNAVGVHVREITANEKLNFKRADVFKTAINLGLVHAPNDTRYAALAKNELKFLQQKGQRIVKQEVGPVQTKDLADTMFECVYYLLGSYIANEFNQDIAKGAQGGYTYKDTHSNREALRSFYDRRAEPPRTRSAKTLNFRRRTA